MGLWVIGKKLGGTVCLLRAESDGRAPPRSNWQQYSRGQWASAPEIEVGDETGGGLFPTRKVSGVHPDPGVNGLYTRADAAVNGRPAYKNCETGYYMYFLRTSTNAAVGATPARQSESAARRSSNNMPSPRRTVTYTRRTSWWFIYIPGGGGGAYGAYYYSDTDFTIAIIIVVLMILIILFSCYASCVSESSRNTGGAGAQTARPPRGKSEATPLLYSQAPVSTLRAQHNDCRYSPASTSSPRAR